MKELAIGEIGYIYGVKVEVCKATITDCCENCAFRLQNGWQSCPSTKCLSNRRKDKTHVYFKEVKNQ